MSERQGPQIETARLILAQPKLTDFDDSAAMWRAPEVVRYLGGAPFTTEDVWNRLLRYIGHWRAIGFGYWIVRDKADGRFVGEVGFGDYHREVHPAFDRAPEIGWGLAPWAHGKGLASEAAKAAVEWGDANLNAHRTVCLIHPMNSASIRIGEKLGYSAYAHTTYKDSPVTLYERQARLRTNTVPAE
jgi:RimJ/RimL family protein N-acetyltransferase